MAAVPLPPPSAAPLWRVTQVVAVALTVALLVGLGAWPELTLRVLWDMVIPVLPAVFLVNPLIWRNVCPLATLNDVTGVRGSGRQPAARLLGVMWGTGVVLLGAMVPARRFFFNQNGPILAATIVGVSGLALLLGARYSRRAGFCNGLCPVLPVEKLYGQFPILRVSSSRCRHCMLCAPVGCIDLAGGKSMAHSLGRRGRTSGWLLTPLGAFAAAFPGFVIGYFTTENVLPAAAGGIYLHVALCAAGSFLLTQLLVRLWAVPSRVAMPLLGGLAAFFYYWFIAPTVAAAYGAPAIGLHLVRAAALVLVAGWLSLALPRQWSHQRRSAQHGGTSLGT